MRIKKIISGIMAVLVVAGAVSVFNANPVKDYAVTASAAEYENLEYEKYSDYIEITGCDKSSKKVVIPAEIEGLPVTSIRYNAFSGCSGLTSITIPDSITSIGGGAFSGTPWLEAKQKENPFVVINNILICAEKCSGDVVIPDSVTSIGGRAFAECSGITSITIPDSVVSIGDYAFYYCSGFTSITVPNSVTSIGSSAFYGCSGLTSITIPNSITSIGDSVFAECSGLTSIIIPDNVTSIGCMAFSRCLSLESITILNPKCEIYDNSSTITNNYDSDYNLYFSGIVRGYSNSTAQAYAKKYGYNFESMGDAPVYKTGDVNGDGKIDATDASAILVEYALASTEQPSGFSESQKKAGDIDGDGKIDSTDASKVLTFYSYLSTGGTIRDMNKWLEL